MEEVASAHWYQTPAPGHAARLPKRPDTISATSGIRLRLRPPVPAARRGAGHGCRGLATGSLKPEGDSVDNRGMDLMHWCAIALTSSLFLRLALAERARVMAELALVPVRVPAEKGYAVRR